MAVTSRSFGEVRPVRTLWSEDMDYVKPADVAASMLNAGRAKLGLSSLDLIIRGGLAGAVLAAATSLAFTAMVQTNQPLVGALIFPVGLILIVLLGLDLVTGSFGLLPLPWMEDHVSSKSMLANWCCVFLGNLVGGFVFTGLALYVTHKPRLAGVVPLAVPTQVPAE
jgi:formate transporter